MHAVFVTHLLWLLHVRLPAKRLSIHLISSLHTHSPWHSQPASSISPSKNKGQRRSTEASSRRSFLSKCQPVPRFTCDCNIILAHNNSKTFSLYRFATKLHNWSTALCADRWCRISTKSVSKCDKSGQTYIHDHLRVVILTSSIFHDAQDYLINRCVRLGYRIL